MKTRVLAKTVLFLFLAGLTYESYKILPLSYQGFNIGECELDLVIWTDDDPSVGIVVDLKVVRNATTPRLNVISRSSGRPSRTTAKCITREW
jgi:methyl coenzyme M reductase beta subunit